MNTASSSPLYTSSLDSTRASPTGQTDASGEAAALRDALKRCSPATYEAAVAYRATGRADYVPVIVRGIIQRFVEPDLRVRLDQGSADLRLAEDLGIDSLTMMEIVLLSEDVLRITIETEELRALCTLGDIQQFLDRKTSVPASATPVSRSLP